MLPELDLIPTRGIAEELQGWLENVIEAGCTDITLMPEERAKGEVNGVYTDISTGIITQSELVRLLNRAYGEGGATRLPEKPLDYAYEIMTADRSRRRFRFNTTKAFGQGQWGYHFSIRILELLPPPLEKIGLTEEFARSVCKDRGMTLVGGGTGHGKSTTLASIMAHILQTKAGKLVTIEAPIEYVYDDVPNKLGYACQHEVGKGINSFNHGLVNALRQKPDWLLVQEIRDRETAETATEASMTGHPLLATIHANSAAEMISRIVDMFPPLVARSKSLEFLRNTNVLIAQRLLPKKKGGKVAVREAFHVDEAARHALAKKDTDDWAFQIAAWLKEDKTDMAAGIKKLANDNVIDEEWIQWTTR